MRRMVSLSDHQLEIVTTAASRAGRAPFCLSGTARCDAENALADSAIYVEVPADSRKNRTAIKKYDS